MQMALLSILRLILLCLSQRAPVIAGFSLQSFLSSRAIPDYKQVTTVNNIRNGIRPAAPTMFFKPQPSSAGPAAVADMHSTWAVPDNIIKFDAALPVDSQLPGSPVTSSGVTFAAPAATGTETLATSSATDGPTAFFDLSTTAPDFTNEYEDSVPGFALTLAERLSMTTEVPMSRFAFYVPDPTGALQTGYVHFCKSNNTIPLVPAFAARYATAQNMSFHCKPVQHTINVTFQSSALLQTAGQRSSSEPSSVTFEVGVYPPTGVSGDKKPSSVVSDDVVAGSVGRDEPERKLLPTGLWTYKAGPGVKFHGLFPGTTATLPGMPAALRETSLPLGPNPGGLGIDMPDKAEILAEHRQHQDEEKEKEREQRSLNEVDAILEKAAKENREVETSLEEQKLSLARASRAHAQVLNTAVYKLPNKLPDGDALN
jgi:hypothetical protein